MNIKDFMNTYTIEELESIHGQFRTEDRKNIVKILEDQNGTLTSQQKNLILNYLPKVKVIDIRSEVVTEVEYYKSKNWKGIEEVYKKCPRHWKEMRKTIPSEVVRRVEGKDCGQPINTDMSQSKDAKTALAATSSERSSLSSFCCIKEV